MPRSKVKIWIHAIWNTKNKEAFITSKAEVPIYKLISKELTNAGCFVKSINGMQDHMHALFLLNPKSTIQDVMKQVKGASSHAINQMKIIPFRFAWGVGYAAFSVSESQVAEVDKYIRNQKVHHRKRTYTEEIDAF